MSYPPSVEHPNSEYRSFLVRLWREPANGRRQGAVPRECLIEVEDISTGEQRYFPSLDEMVAYFRAHWFVDKDEPRGDSETEETH